MNWFGWWVGWWNGTTADEPSALTVTGYAPSVQIDTTSIAPSPAVVVITSAAPTVTVSGGLLQIVWGAVRRAFTSKPMPVTVTIGCGEVRGVAFAPRIATPVRTVPSPARGEWGGFAPDVSASHQPEWSEADDEEDLLLLVIATFADEQQ